MVMLRAEPVVSSSCWPRCFRRQPLQCQAVQPGQVGAIVQPTSIGQVVVEGDLRQIEEALGANKLGDFPQADSADAVAPAAAPKPSKPTKELQEKVWDWVVEQHLVVFLVLAFMVGLSLPIIGKSLSDPQVSLGPLGHARVANFLLLLVIFFIAGFRLKTDAVVGALKSPRPLIAAMAMILFVTPCVGFLTAALPLATKEIAYGLTVFCCVPTTLTSGAALITGCRGTERATELALMTTVATNLLGSFTMPPLLSLMLKGADADLNPAPLVGKLMLSILVPMLLGKVVRDKISGGAKFAKDKKVPLTVASNACLCLIVWISVSRSRENITSQPAGEIFACIVCGLALHFVFWAVNLPLTTCAKIQDLHHSRAVFLLASQKTLPVSIAVISGLPESFGHAGLIALPCIFGHLSQLLIDSVLVAKWTQKPEETLVPMFGSI